MQEALVLLLPDRLTDLVGALQTHKTVILDGTFLSYTNKYNKGHYSGKHQQSGVVVQVITSLTGELVWFSPALPGATHDTKASRIFDIAGAATITGAVVYADKGYVGANVDGLGQQRNTICHMSRVYKNSDPSVKELNKIISSLRRVVETPFSRLKNYNILKKCRMYLSSGLASVDRMFKAVVSLHVLEEKSW